MNQQERNELREKHYACDCGHCENNECKAGCVGDYPCDTIKVLDWAEGLSDRMKFIEENLSGNTIVNASKIIYSNDDYDL